MESEFLRRTRGNPVGGVATIYAGSMFKVEALI